jgi:lycopene cyclase domain-containing protein
MTYWLLDAGFLAAVLVVAIAAGARIRRRSRRSAGRVGAAAGIAAAIVVVLTAAFDNLLIAAGIIAYDRTGMSGLTVGLAPLEDFAYAIAAGIGLPSLWVLLGRDDR